MIITGSAIFIKSPDAELIRCIRKFPGVTFQAQSDAGDEIVVNFEAENHADLEILCADLKRQFPDIIDITHIYINFEEDAEKASFEMNVRNE
jgi:hypothetical protein